METVENQTAVFHRSHSPAATDKARQEAADPKQQTIVYTKDLTLPL
jgi:hypothetical protein